MKQDINITPSNPPTLPSDNTSLLKQTQPSSEKGYRTLHNGTHPPVCHDSLSTTSTVLQTKHPLSTRAWAHEQLQTPFRDYQQHRKSSIQNKAAPSDRETSNPSWVKCTSALFTWRPFSRSLPKLSIPVIIERKKSEVNNSSPIHALKKTQVAQITKLGSDIACAAIFQHIPIHNCS